MAQAQIVTWGLHEVYVQANLIDGFRYLDLSGVVLNRIRRDFTELVVVDPGGTVLRTPKREGLPYAVRFGPERIWLHYAPVESLEKVAITAPAIIRDIARDIEARQFDRLGLRAVYYVPCQNPKEASFAVTSKLVGGPFLPHLTPSPHEELRFALEIPFGSDDMEIMVRVRKLDISRPTQAPGDYPQSGLIFDLDVGQRPSEGASYRSVDIPGLIEGAVRKARQLLLDLGHPILEGVTL